MRVAYSISNSVKWGTEAEQATCGTIRRLLYDRHLSRPLFAAVRGHGTTAGNAKAVFDFVVEKTMPFGKPYEALSLVEIAGATNVCKRTVSNVLKALLSLGFITKMKDCHGVACFYAVNLETVVPAVRRALNAMSDKLKAKAVLVEDADALLASPVFAGMCRVVKSFADYVVVSVESIKAKFTEVCQTAMSDLKTAVQQAVVKSAQRATEKRTKKAIEPFFTSTGQTNTRTILEFWHDQVLRHPAFENVGYLPKSTGKMRGLIKSWVKELVACGIDSEDAIRHEITRLIHQWSLVRPCDRRLQVTNDKDKTYSIMIPVIPDFSFFFINRQALVPVFHLEQPEAVPGALCTDNPFMLGRV